MWLENPQHEHVGMYERSDESLQNKYRVINLHISAIQHFKCFRECIVSKELSYADQEHARQLSVLLNIARVNHKG